MNTRRNILQESLEAIERLQARLQASESALHQPIAIVGAGCRYPGGIESPEALWDVVREGRDQVAGIPADRWNADAYYDPDPQAPGKMITRRGGFLTQVDRFDAQFFGISPREATTLDPQQRLLLETAQEALDSAAIATDRLAGSLTGVFVGISMSDYAQLMRTGGATYSDVYAATGSTLNAAAGRIAFTFGFHGPCVAIDTACSSSLVAVHMACQSLRTGESRLALAGAVNVILTPDAMVLFSKWGMLAPDGACKTFDATADGLVRAEGCAVIALKRLADAIADGDPIMAVIRGSAANSDGRSSGLTVPNGLAQQAVIRAALASGQLKPEDIDYVEAHGTGTSLGDPIEVEALGAVLGEGRSPDRPLAIGSIKTNIGHAEAAAGLAGLLKVVMSLKHEAIPPHLHFSTPSPGIPWDDLLVTVPTQLQRWPRGGSVRRAGVSAFGLSGTNAHVILEEAPAGHELTARLAVARSPGADELFLVPISARDTVAAREMAARYADFLASTPALPLVDVVTTLAVGRTHYSRRFALLCDSSQGLQRDLRALSEGQLTVAAAEGTTRTSQQPKIAFLFTGQGAQYAGMGRGLYDREPVFRTWIDKAAAVLAPLLERPLLDVLFPQHGADAALAQTAYTQPALFALEYALAELWQSWGITPSIVAGHSVGEYVAACVAGVFDFEQGLALIAERARLMQALPSGGGMAAVFASAASIAPRVAAAGGRVSIAAVNGPEETVIAGDSDALTVLVEELVALGIRSKVLEVSHAFHSARLDPMLDSFERRAAAVPHSLPRVPLVSNLTGTIFPSGGGPDARYWRRHAREPVQFAACIESLKAAGVTMLVEVGPHPTLLALAGRAIPGAAWGTAASLRRGREDAREMLTALATLFARGASIRWDTLLRGRGRRVSLPTYAFQRERYWVSETAAAPSPGIVTSGAHPLLGQRQRSPQPGARFLGEVTANQPSFLTDHVVLGNVLMPGTAFIEMALAAAQALGSSREIALEGFAVDSPLLLDDRSATLLHTELESEVSGRSRFTICSSRASGADGESWRVHARGTLVRAGSYTPEQGEAASVAAAKARCNASIDVAGYYLQLEQAGISFGPGFRAVRSLHLGNEEAVGLLGVPGAVAESAAGWVLHPALLDSAFQLLGALLMSERKSRDSAEQVYVLVGVEQMWVSGTAPDRVWATVRLRATAADAVMRVADARLENEAGELVGLVTGVQLRQITSSALSRALGLPRIAAHSYFRRWAPVVKAATDSVKAAQRYLLVADQGGFAITLAEALRASGATCEIGENSTLTGAMSRAQWIIDCSALDFASSDDLVPTVRRAYQQLLSLAKTLASSGANCGLCILSRGAQAVTPDDRINLAQAPVTALARTLGAELTHNTVIRMDLDPSVSPDARLVLAALMKAGAQEPEVALRNQAVLAPRLEALAPVESAPANEATQLVRRDGSYLVTGGLGGLGFAAAEWLAMRGAGEIVLVGRSALRPDDRGRLEALQKNRTRVTFVACDVGDEGAVDRLWHDVLTPLPPLRGIIHAAGALADAPLHEQDESHFAVVAQAKIAGAWNLHRRSAGAALDFFVMYSSTSAWFGSAGQANYAAANGFLDTLATYRHAHGQPATSIAWGAWAEFGMAARMSDTAKARLERLGVGFLDVRDGIAMLESSVRSRATNVVAVALDLQRAAAHATPAVRALFGRQRTADGVQQPPDARARLQGARTSLGPERREILCSYLRMEAARALGFDAAALDLEIPLSTLGFDSLMAVQIRNSIQVDLGLALPLVRLLQGPTIAQLADDVAAGLDVPAAAPAPTAAEIWEEGSL